MGKIRNLIAKTSVEAKTLALNVRTGELTLTKTDRMLFIAMAVVTMLFFAFSVTLAAPTGFFAAIESRFWTYYSQFAKMATIVALLSITVGLLWIMLSPSSKSSATPIAWIKKVLLCYFLLMVIGGVFGVINELTNGYGWQTMKP